MNRAAADPRTTESEVSAVRALAIGTPRLVLEPLCLDHAEPMAQALADPRLHFFMGGSPASPEQLRVRYRRILAGSDDADVDWCNWALRTRSDARIIGTVQATVTTGRRGRTADMAWVLGMPWQGRGLAKEAALALVAWLAEQDVTVVEAHIHPEHRASQGVATAAGLAPTDREVDEEIVWRAVLAAPPIVPAGRESDESGR